MSTFATFDFSDKMEDGFFFTVYKNYEIKSTKGKIPFYHEVFFNTFVNTNILQIFKVILQQ